MSFTSRRETVIPATSSGAVRVPAVVLSDPLESSGYHDGGGGDSDTSAGNGGGIDQLASTSAGAGAAENLLEKKTRAVRVTFKETHLISQDGMWKLYSQMQALQNKKLSNKKGNEVSS